MAKDPDRPRQTSGHAGLGRFIALEKNLNTNYAWERLIGKISCTDSTAPAEVSVQGTSTGHSLKEFLKEESISGDAETDSPLSANLSRYILKTISLDFRDKKLETLYLKANIQQPRLTHQEEFFLIRLVQMAAMAIYNFGLDRLGKKREYSD